MTPERRAEIEQTSLGPGVEGYIRAKVILELLAEIDRLTAENAACADDVRNMVASLDAESREIDRLNNVLDQLLDVIETHYDDNFGIDATDSSIVWGIEWEDSAECVWTDEEKPELAAELERRSKA